MAENIAVDEAKKLVADIEAVVVPVEHRYAGMVTTKLNEAKTWATKMVEELSGGSVPAEQAAVAPETPEAGTEGASETASDSAEGTEGADTAGTDTGAGAESSAPADAAPKK